MQLFVPNIPLPVFRDGIFNYNKAAYRFIMGLRLCCGTLLTIYGKILPVKCEMQSHIQSVSNSFIMFHIVFFKSTLRHVNRQTCNPIHMVYNQISYDYMQPIAMNRNALKLVGNADLA